MKKLLGIILVLLAGGSIAWNRYAPRAAPSWNGWTTEAIERGTLIEGVTASGAVQHRDSLPVFGEAPGRVVRVLVDTGTVVKAGDPLCQLDDRLAGLRVQQAKLAIEIAQADAVRAEAGRDAAVAALQRARDPSGQIQPVGHTDTAEYQRRSAEAVLRMAQAKVRESQTAAQLAELALDQMILRAPVNGVVTEKRVTVGQMVSPAGPALFTVAPELEYVQLVALVAEADIGRVRVGQAVNVSANAWPEDTFLGRVARIGLAPVPTPGAVQFPVTIDLANVKDANTREWKLRTGMSASAEMVVRKHDNVWRLPAAAAGVTFDESRLSEPAKRKLARLAARTDRADWQRVWLMTQDRGPWPVIVRVGGRTTAGDTGIQDAQWIEVLGWDPEESAPVPGGAVPQVIVGVPESAKAAKPGLKLF